MTYRADIDGLRAVAVLMVMFFHYAGIDRFSGYIGVDIFFVISGFLITGIINSELGVGTFSLARFYERRIRRIMPAFSAMLIVTTALAYILFLPAEMIAFAKSLIGAALFGSNFVFWAEAGYFDMAAELKPLLHTWSLAIEEQFYILFPLFMMAGYRLFRAHVARAVLALCALSFLTNIALIHCDMAGTAFYMIVSRAWELMIGALIALYGASYPLKPRAQSACLWFGAACIVIGFVCKVDPEDFPGFYALLPTLGAGMIIYAGQFGEMHAVSRVLSTRSMVAIGKMSYSLYLWHWPLYVFAVYYGLGNIDAVQTITLAAGCFVLSYVSWRFIEQPVRHHTSLHRASLFSVTALVMIAASLAGAFFLQAKGMTRWHDAHVLALTDVTIGGGYAGVAAPDSQDAYTIERIGVQDADAPATLALWGDSHATAIAPAVHQALQGKHKSGFLIRNNTCFVLLQDQEKYKNDTCVMQTERVMEYLLAQKNIRTVVLANRWALHFSQMQRRYGALDDRAEADMAAWRARSLQRVIDTLTWAGKRVIVFGPVPEVIAGSDNIPSLAARIHHQGLSVDLRPTPMQFQQQEAAMMPTYRIIEDKTKAHMIWPHDTLCDDTRCQIERDGRMMYYDDDHLSSYGALIFTPVFKSLL